MTDILFVLTSLLFIRARKNFACEEVERMRTEKFGLDRENSFNREDSDPLGAPGREFENLSSGYSEVRCLRRK